MAALGLLTFGTEQENSAICERLPSARGVSFLVSLAGLFSSCFLPCLVLFFEV
jgi:hypothetical protein